MASSNHFPLNEPFKPEPALVTWLSVDFVLLFLLILSFTLVPVMLATGPDPAVVSILAAVAIIPILVFVAWVRLYYQSMWYELREDEISWKRGVWFRTTGIVPYNRITNIDIRQGPVMRVLGISTVSLQTAGYSGQAVPEIRIEGMEHAGELREVIRSLVRRCGAGGDGTGGVADRSPPVQKNTDQAILGELVRIRQLLETQGK